MSQNFEQFGKYILLEKLATGGMAEVYLGKNPGIGISKLVAIKRILPQFSESPEFIEMFKDEAKIAINLSHGNVVSIHEFGTEQDQFFLVMEYVEGRNLRQILNKMKKSNQQFSIEQALFIIKDVAAGLDHAHRCMDSTTGKPLMIIHRDMSPQNIMVSFEGEVKIVDFGIAKAETQLENTRAGTLKGKFGYMSPEQAEGQTVDLRTDIFSIGIVMWELLANDRLFIANNEVNTLRKIKECQIPSLRKINPNIPQELEKICEKALAKDKNLRYQSSAAFHRDLNRFLNRHYPDFSPHDFSVFIKTLFAAEILDNRKKQIEYAKVEARPVLQNFADKTIVTNTATFTETTGDIADFSNDKREAKTASIQTRPQIVGAKFAPESEGRPETRSNVPAAQSPQRPLAQPVRPIEGFQPPPKTKVPQQELSIDRRDRSDRSSRNNWRESTTAGTTGYSGSGTSSGYRNATGTREIRSQKLSSMVATFFIALIGFSVCGGGLHYYLYPSKTREYVAIAMQKAGIQVPGKSPGPLNSKDIASKTSRLAVSSRPSNAWIFVDGVQLAKTTPDTIEIKENEGQPGHWPRKVTVKLKKEGFNEWTTTVDLTGDEDAPVSITANLVQSRQATLDVIVRGAGEVYINGQKVSSSGPVTGFVVPADEDIIVRVFDPTTKATDEQTVRIPEGKFKSVTLSPRAAKLR